MPRGVSRPSLGQMRISSAEFIEQAPLDDLSHILRVNARPVRDKVTWKYEFDPTVEGVRHYVEGAVANSFKGKKASGRDDVKDLIGRRDRAKWHIVDSVERNMWSGSAIARHRLSALDVMAASVVAGLVFQNRDIQVNAADAVWDFGHSLYGDVSEPTKDIDYPNGDIAIDIAHVGEELGENPELFLVQGALLDLVAEEQQRRIDFFQLRFDVAVEAYGNKLSQSDLAAEDDLKQLLEIWNTSQAV